jgi:MFS transporter, Spinster family, sphingosine-1-phosphate transporter
VPQTTRNSRVIAVILAVTALNYLDRSILPILLHDIAEDLRLDDGRVGLLAGLPFALMYALAGLPAARIADEWHRPRLISIAVTGWSLATAACGLASGFWTLFAARVCVGVGEGVGTPATHSMLAERAPPTKLAGAAALFTLAGAMGAWIGYAGGGALADLWGWRAACVIVALPGLAVAAIVIAFVRENRVAPRVPALAEIVGRLSRQVIRGLWQRKAYRSLVIGFALLYFVQTGVEQWLAVYAIRTFNVSAGEVGLLLGTYSAAAMALGTLAGGWLGNRLAPLGLRWLLRLPALFVLACVPCYAAMLLADSVVALGAFGALASFLAGALFGPLLAALYGLADGRERATAVAFCLFVVNVIGLSLGPLVVGALSEALQMTLDGGSLRAAMMTVVVLLLPGALMFAFASRRLEQEWQGDNRAAPAGAVRAHGA